MKILNKLTWLKYHKWAGVVFALFLMVFCFSGVILNHRNFFASYDVSRSFLPSSYHVHNFNQGIVKGTLRTDSTHILAYGYNGVWLTDNGARHWTECNAGFPSGVDRRSIRNMVMTKDSLLWCATNYDAYWYDGNKWQCLNLPKGNERLMDMAVWGDNMLVVALSRSAVYIIKHVNNGNAQPHICVKRKELAAAKDFKNKDTLFRTVWKLHSGELFGQAGKLVVDAIALGLFFLCLTGIILFLLPYNIRRNKRKGCKEACKMWSKHLVWNNRWHVRIGYSTIFLTMWLTITGTCLRPPLMVPFVLTKSAPVNYTGNVWNDRLRSIRWDHTKGEWLLHTADGFMRVDATFASQPRMLDSKKTPTVSPMGANVFMQHADGKWLIGSFAGMMVWNPATNSVTDYFTGKTPEKHFGGVLSNTLVCGYSEDFARPVVFDYSKGALTECGWHEMPEKLAATPMSLWNLALELHVGRCYSPLLGPLSDLFVFIWGTMSTLVLLSGYIIYRRRRKKRCERKKHHD